MANIPMDIITDLFLRLPATTLLRCRILSKPCFSLIDSPDFIASHLSRTLETGDHLMILLRGPRILRTVYLDAPEEVSDVDHPLQAGGLTDVFGSCNGVIGLHNSPTDLALFNPSTRKIHRLPLEPIDSPESLVTREFVFYGLGYDSANDDYKVVRLIQCKGPRGDLLHAGPVEIKLFSLKRNSWRRIELCFETHILFNFYYHPSYRRENGVLASNNLHWVLPRRHRFIALNTILRFDLATEEFDVLDFPWDFVYEDVDLGVLDGCLCLMCNHENYVDIWIRKEYEIEGSWAKLFKVPKPDNVESLDLVRPLLYSKDRSKVLLEINNAKNLVWFDLPSKGFTTLKFKDCDTPYSVELLVSSLVLGCKGDPNEVKRRKEHKRNDFLSKGFKLKL